MQEILTVTELTSQIKKNIESRFPSLSVRGEISNFKEQASGHLYFTLKDAQAQISAALFKGNVRALTRMPKAGDEVIVKGELNLYAQRGTYQIIVRELHYTGLGELLLKLHELKLKLEKRGWFDQQAKKPLPKFPKTIGVVTSPTGSVIQDILHILNRRFSGFHLILNPVKVQGDGASLEIAQAVEQFNRYRLADVLIVGRGGGSLEDLWSFNEEIVAAAIYASQIPIISAVGHETDFSIADCVADIRAPTPSAAAEIVIGEKAHYLQALTQTHSRLKTHLLSLVREHSYRLERFTKQNLFSSPYALLGHYHQRIDEIRTDLEESALRLIREKRLGLLSLNKQTRLLQPQVHLALSRQKLEKWERDLERLSLSQLERRKQRLLALVNHLKSIDPKSLLTKGYCILFEEKRDCVILSSRELKKMSQFRVSLHDGEVIAAVVENKT
jgi:exodeoxyribonuclease VII large subunit